MREFAILAFLRPSGLQSGFWNGGENGLKSLLDVGCRLFIFTGNSLSEDALGVHAVGVANAPAFQTLRHIVVE